MYIVKTGDNLLSIARERVGLPYKVCRVGSNKQIGKHYHLSGSKVLRFAK